MSDGESLRFPEWEREYRAALAETDNTKLSERLHAAENAIVKRLQVLAQDRRRGRAERVAIQDAIHAIRVIQLDELGYPAWEGEGGRGKKRGVNRCAS